MDDHEARRHLELWVEDSRPALLRQLRRSIGPHLSRHVEPEDILQDSLLAFLEGFGSEPLSNRDDLRRRILAIARNRILMIARRDSLRVVVSARACDPHRERGPALVPSETSRPRIPIAGLDLDHRLSLLLRDWLGLSWESIAFVLDRPSKNAVQLLHYRARRAARTTAPRP